MTVKEQRVAENLHRSADEESHIATDAKKERGEALSRPAHRRTIGKVARRRRQRRLAGKMERTQVVGRREIHSENRRRSRGS